MNSSSRIVHLLSSWNAIVSVVAGMAALSVLLCSLSGLSPMQFLALRPTQLSVLLLFIALLIRLTRKVRERDAILLPLGCTVMLLGVLVNYGFRSTGTVSLGPGETFEGRAYETNKGGIWRRPPQLRLKIDEIRQSDPGRTTMHLNPTAGARLSLSDGEADGGILSPRITLLKSGLAPRFVITDRAGAILDAIFVKGKKAGSADPEHFRSARLPHRIYFRMNDTTAKPVSVMVTRGKLAVREWLPLAQGEKVEFEGYAVYYTEVTPWAELEVSTFPGNIVMLIGALLIAAGAAGAVLAHGVRGKVDSM